MELEHPRDPGCIDTPAAPAYIRWGGGSVEGTMAKGTFGDNLKREREMRGVTLEEISGATRIATRFLQAIENEEWSQLPGGVFNRGFVRAVARYLGLDEENIVAEYAMAVGDRPSVPVWTGSPPAVTPETPWLAWFLAAVVLIALITGAWFGTKRLLAWRSEKMAAQPATASGPSPSADDSATDPRTEPAPPVETAPAPENAPSGTVNPPEAPAVAPDSAAAAPPPSAGTDPIRLKVETVKKMKVIVQADNEVVFDGAMKAGENHFFTATDHFQVSAKDAGALHLALNGKELAPIGTPGHSAKVTLSRDSLKATGGAN